MLFAKRHLRNKEGNPWTLEGRQWVADEFWAPATGFKLWPIDPAAICEECLADANTIVEWTSHHPSQSEEHRLTGCKGLELSPIIITVLNLPRREGKTFNVAALNLSTICIDKHSSITYVASSEDQTAQLFIENYGMPIKQDPALRKACRIVGNKIYNDKNKSFFEFVPTSHSSITGRGRTMVQIDEARDIPARVAMALIPSIFDQFGIECPRGCMHAGVMPDPPKLCKVCRSKLRPWYARAIITSSSGLVEGGEKDWFAELVEFLEANPQKNYHLYKLDQSTNPAVSQVTKGAVEAVFGQLDSTKTYTDIELFNQSRRKGEDFVGAAQLNRITDQSLANLEGSDLPCVGFLDCSWSGDTTSLVILVDDPSSAYPWEMLTMVRLDKWKPKKLPGGVIDPQLIQVHFDRVIPMFPRLIVCGVDVRGMEWPKQFCEWNRANRPGWGRKIAPFQGNVADRDLAWQLLEQRLLSGKIKIFGDNDLRAELLGVRRVTRTDGSVEIRDRSRKKRHADIADGVAAGCLLAYREQTRKGGLSLSQADRRGDQLAKIWRPATAGLRADRF